MEFSNDDEDDSDGSMFMGKMPCSCMVMNPPMTSLLGSEDESLVFGDALDDCRLFSLFFIVEFQKFLISLSVLPGKRAAI
jgi:hypothetical protein